MDVSISPADKRAREDFISARDKKQADKAERAERRKARRKKKSDAVTARRLRRRIKREVRTDLLAEKKLFLTGQATGGEYEINTRIRYKKSNWRYQRSHVEGVLREVLAQHTGFESKLDFDCDHDDWCNRIRIWYTLQDSQPTPS